MPRRAKDLVKPGGVVSGIMAVKGGALENLLRGLGVDKDTRVQDALVAWSGDDRVAEAIHKIRGGYMRSMAAAFTTSGIHHREFLEILSKVQVARALGEALRGALTANQDMAEDARSRQALCARCDGLTRVPCEEHDPGAFISRVVVAEVLVDGKPTGETAEQPVWRRTCPACDGTGKIRQPGDKASRQMILEQAGLLKRGPAVLVNLTNYAGLGLADSPASSMTLDVEGE